MAAPELTPGQTLGHFRLIEEIGAGAFGIVYRAWDTRLERDVAVKVLNQKAISDESARKRFRHEALILSRLNHPNIESVYDFHSENGVDYLVMEYVPGVSLNERQTAGALPEKEVLSLGIQLARGLAAAHAQRVLHRDLKPGNLRVTPDKLLKILDFGLAQLFALPEDETLTTDKTLDQQQPWAGTPAYLSPEQAEWIEPDTRSDIYSAGVVLYELATGSRPFPQRGEALRNAILHAPPPTPRLTNKEISPGLEAVILKCLEKAPKLRYQSANELLDDLKELARGSGSYRAVGVTRRPAWRSPRALAPHWPYKWRKTLLALCVLVVVGVATIGLNRYRHSLKPIASVAVLPIVNRTGDPGFNYLSEGITTALTNDLSKASGVAVTAESMAGRLAGKNLDPGTAGRDLAVQTVVSGSVATKGARLLLQIELVDVNTGSLIWGETYDRSQAELAALQEDVARELAYRLRIRLEADASERLRRQYRTNSAAYDAYLKGRYALRDRSASGFESALGYFQQAIDHDSQYAPAFAGMADTYCLMAYNRIQPTITLLGKCKDAANRALHLDSTLAEAYASLANAVTLLDFNWTAAEEMYRRSVQLDPSYLPAHLRYGLTLLTPLGRRSEAMAQVQYALRADPDALMTHVTLSLVEYSAGDYDAAISELERVKQNSPPFARADEVLVEVYLAKNMPADVIRIVTESSPPTQESREVLAIALGIAYARMGRQQLALKQLTEAEAALKHGYSLNYEMAALCAALGYRQKALDYLEKALSARQTSILFVNVDPLMEPLRSDERFHQLLSTLHLT